ncbi:hypothetical protein [Caballeronia ptereochthonis]|uniref:hypothetical protein n=1 Tax=Caballeronia ptereochthonis TaxID=1777144 RepID=UPI00117E4616|nr:hypothetical protein [Caballeronia ptereochthonis]
MRDHGRLARRLCGADRRNGERNGGMEIPVAGMNIDGADRRVTNPKPAARMLKECLNPKHCAWCEMLMKGW